MPVPTYDLFISYSSQDRPWADKLYNDLRASYPDIDVFWDRAALPVGGPWRTLLTGAVISTKHLVFFWSQAAKASAEVEPEIAGFEAEKNQTPVVDGCTRLAPVPVTLEDPPRGGGSQEIQGFPDFRQYYDPKAQDRGISRLATPTAAAEWNRAIRMLGGAIRGADSARPITAAIAATTEERVQRLLDNTHRPPQSARDPVASVVLERASLQSQGEPHADGITHADVNRRGSLERGYAILRGGSASLGEMRKLASAARDLRAFSLARRLLALVRQHRMTADLPAKEKLKLIQQHALCTYKDTDLATDDRCERAFAILREGDLSDNQASQETLGLAGAIYKMLWKYTGQRSHLEASLAYYARGSAESIEGDFGYTRINAAYVLDVLAAQAQAHTPAAAEQYRDRATRLREGVIAALPDLATQSAYTWLKNEWWFGATLAEAFFGLGKFSQARFWLREALALRPPDWQLESTTRQLASLAQLADDASTDREAWQTLAILVGDAQPALRAIVRGKMGLALSGGGFRASLFHIGVLARLAELDMLRHIEVLSCVSGGSIIGAHYYLEVRSLLQRKPDREITREDYIDIVSRIERDFLAGVQKNMRTRLLAGWWANLRTLVQPGYTRTHYLGELLERYLYAKVENSDGPLWLNELRIIPEGARDDFNPQLDNWRRAAKVPILLLNATSLNTGHNWQFAVSWMGEPPIGASSAVDRNELLRRLYYSDAPPKYQRVRLGHAVAASACVPGLFDPMDLDGLYPGRIVRLVDGGVHDNQGVGGLLEQECAVVIASDASGQMNSQAQPSAEAYSVPIRSNDILMGRVREEEFRQLHRMRLSGALSALTFLHLKKDLDQPYIDWQGCKEPYAAFDEHLQSQRGYFLTSYEMPKLLQGRLAGLRTDLDSFSDLEAYTLMLSGYRMADVELEATLGLAAASESASHEPWQFLKVEHAVDGPVEGQDHRQLMNGLRVGYNRGFKVWRLRPTLPILTATALIAAAVYGILEIAQVSAGFAGLNREFMRFPPTDLAGPVVCALGAFVAVLFAVLVILRKLGTHRKSFTAMFSALLMITVGWFFARLHLWIFDRFFLAAGRVSAPIVGTNVQRVRARRP